MQATHQMQPYDVPNSAPTPRELDDASRAHTGSGSALLNVNVHATERLASTLIGGILLARGLTQPSGTRRLLAVLGSGLLFRGVTGHCHVYRWLNLNTAAE